MKKKLICNNPLWLTDKFSIETTKAAYIASLSLVRVWNIVHVLLVRLLFGSLVLLIGYRLRPPLPKHRTRYSTGECSWRRLTTVRFGHCDCFT